MGKEDDFIIHLKQGMQVDLLHEFKVMENQEDLGGVVR